MDESCPFCRKLAGLEALPPGEVVWHFPHSIAFLGQWQFYEGYTVLISRRHATELCQLADDERRLFLDEMCLLARAIEEEYRPHKLNYELLGNQVPHLHWHIFPRMKADHDHTNPVWLALDKAERDPDMKAHLQGNVDRPSITENLRRHLHSLGAPHS